MPFTERPPMGPGWFIFFQGGYTPDGDGGAGGDQFIQPGQSLTNFNKFDVQLNNNVILLTESGVI